VLRYETQLLDALSTSDRRALDRLIGRLIRPRPRAWCDRVSDAKRAEPQTSRIDTVSASFEDKTPGKPGYNRQDMYRSKEMMA
jgi:hypothetical protein